MNIYYSLPYSIRRLIYATLRKREFNFLQQKRLVDTNSGYSFKPFDDKKCIFVHIPKAAGVSICKTLFNNLAGSHRSIAIYQLVFSKDEFNNYFKFSFVRNPWDRVFSAYNFLKKGGMNDTDRNWAASNLAEYDNFDDFVRGWLTCENIDKYIHFKPQYHFLCLPESEKLQVDFLGYYENIEQDFEYIRNKLALDKSITLKYKNKTESMNRKTKDYRAHYTEETRNIVQEVYQKDIKLFGYDFDNTSLKKQLSNRFMN